MARKTPTNIQTVIQKARGTVSKSPRRKRGKPSRRAVETVSDVTQARPEAPFFLSEKFRGVSFLADGRLLTPLAMFEEAVRRRAAGSEKRLSALEEAVTAPDGDRVARMDRRLKLVEQAVAGMARTVYTEPVKEECAECLRGLMATLCRCGHRQDTHVPSLDPARRGTCLQRGAGGDLCRCRAFESDPVAHWSAEGVPCAGRIPDPTCKPCRKEMTKWVACQNCGHWGLKHGDQNGLPPYNSCIGTFKTNAQGGADYVPCACKEYKPEPPRSVPVNDPAVSLHYFPSSGAKAACGGEGMGTIQRRLVGCPTCLTAMYPVHHVRWVPRRGNGAAEALEVTSCLGCPFAYLKNPDPDHAEWACKHPAIVVKGPGRTLGVYPNGKPPVWCPLAGAGTLVVLKVAPE